MMLMDSSQDYQFCHCRNHSHWHSESRLEILDRMDRPQYSIFTGDLLFVPRDR